METDVETAVEAMFAAEISLEKVQHLETTPRDLRALEELRDPEEDCRLRREQTTTARSSQATVSTWLTSLTT